MRPFHIRPEFSRRPLRSMLVGTAIFAGVALLAVGAVLGLALLAAGALVHLVLRAVRGVPLTRRPAQAAEGAVIDGEFRVVDSRPTTPGSLPHAS